MANVKPAASTSPTFEQQLAELEQVVEQLERGDLALEESVSLFERGMQLSNACRTQLASAESRIQVLVNPRESGPVVVEDLAVELGDGEIAEDEDEGDFAAEHEGK